MSINDLIQSSTVVTVKGEKYPITFGMDKLALIELRHNLSVMDFFTECEKNTVKGQLLLAWAGTVILKPIDDNNPFVIDVEKEISFADLRSLSFLEFQNILTLCQKQFYGSIPSNEEETIQEQGKKPKKAK